jgi:uncharacterized protein (DUF488 family)
MRRIFLAHLEEPAAQDGLDTLADIVRSGKRACLLCFEADPSHCHRAIVADAIAARMPVGILNLRPEIEE